MKNTGLEEDRKALSCQLEDEKEKAERHVAELLEEKVRLNDIIAVLQTESLALKNQLTNSVQECQVLSTQLIEKNVKYLEMKSTISRLDEEVTYLENTKASLEMERDSISSSMMEEREKFHNECSLADEREQFKKECSVLNSSVAELTQKLEHCDNERSNLNQTIQELKTMIVHLEKDKEALSSQLEENWKLIEKIEPFRDVLDNFEMEKKLLLERDKYTSEQMERLTKEAIKNMGHQNHRQKVKYVETLKKIAPVIATAQCDSSKMTQTPGEPRIPFKGKKNAV
nr:hyaluronan-mediated motility receptor-like [Biomphalaria glabrata]